MDFSAYESIITKRLLYFWIIGFIALILSIISIVYLIRNMRNQKLLFWILMVLSFSVVIGMTILVENITVDSIYDITNQAYRVQEGKFQICNDIETRSGSCSLILPDGTKLETDAYDFEAGFYIGRVVYGEKSKVALDVKVFREAAEDSD